MPGLKFQKLDLHVHTPASKCYRQRDHTPEQIVQAALDRGLAAIAITDHNTAEWIDPMKRAAAGTGLVIFPGVEISMSEGFHLVALFDPGAGQEHVKGFLNFIEIENKDFGAMDALCKISVYEVIEKIHKRDGLAILAHIDEPKGAFYELTAAKENGKVHVPVPCSKLFNEARYDAVECGSGKLPVGYDRRFTRTPAFYQASDNPDPDKPTRHSLEGIASRYTWFKLDSIDLEGLRQCFVDPEPEVRIWSMDAYHEIDYPHIASMKVGGAGFLTGQCFDFHHGLNCIIGSQGVGKSLAIEFLRFGLGQPTLDRALLTDHASKIARRLGENGRVEIVYQLQDGTRYRIERTYTGSQKGEDGALVHSESCCTNLTNGSEYAGDIPAMFPVLAYSQTEVVKIAENRNAQLELIDKFIDPRPYEQEITALQAVLRENDSKIDRALQARGRLDSYQREIETLQARIVAINTALAQPLFETMRWSELKKQAIEDERRFIAGLGIQVRNWQQIAREARLTPLPEAFAGDPLLLQQREYARQALQTALDSLTAAAAELSRLEGCSEQAIAGWIPEFDQVYREYHRLLEEIGGDQEAKENERKQLEDRKIGLEREAEAYRTTLRGQAALETERNEQLDRLEKAYEAYYQARKAKFDQLTRLSLGKLSLRLEHAGDRSVYEEKLVELLRGGQNSPSVSERKQIARNLMPRRLVELVVARDQERLAQEAQISELWAGRVVDKLWSSEDFKQVLALQHNCYPGDVPGIAYRKEGGEYAELSELSVGQKCTALLIIALCDGHMPVVIDQPEDALDLVSVWQDIAKKLRRGKNARQFILTTHNSSVAVGADTDQFIVLDAGANAGKVIAAGAIDRPEVKQVVIDHLEGGDEPYKLRSRKYNLK